VKDAPAAQDLLSGYRRPGLRPRRASIGTRAGSIAVQRVFGWVWPVCRMCFPSIATRFPKLFSSSTKVWCGQKLSQAEMSPSWTRVFSANCARYSARTPCAPETVTVSAGFPEARPSLLCSARADGSVRLKDAVLIRTPGRLHETESRRSQRDEPRRPSSLVHGKKRSASTIQAPANLLAGQLNGGRTSGVDRARPGGKPLLFRVTSSTTSHRSAGHRGSARTEPG
jgi:hypothetical protein